MVVAATPSKDPLNRSSADYHTIIGHRTVPSDTESIMHAAMWLQHAGYVSRRDGDSGTCADVSKAVNLWKASKRISLAQVLNYGDAIAMYNWRKLMSIWSRDEIRDYTPSTTTSRKVQ